MDSELKQALEYNYETRLQEMQAENDKKHIEQQEEIKAAWIADMKREQEENE